MGREQSWKMVPRLNLRVVDDLPTVVSNEFGKQRGNVNCECSGANGPCRYISSQCGFGAPKWELMFGLVPRGSSRLRSSWNLRFSNVKSYNFVWKEACSAGEVPGYPIGQL